MKKQPIRGNDCLVSIASEHGLTPRECWDHAGNAALREVRQYPNSLTQGDEIELSDTATGLSLSVDTHHDLQLAPAKFELPVQLLDASLNPLADLSLHCDWIGSEERLTATTNHQGVAHFRLPLTCDKGLLTYELDGEAIIRPFTVGTLLPPEDDAGMAQRLSNLWPDASPGSHDLETLLPALAHEFDLSEDELTQCLLGDPT